MNVYVSVAESMLCRDDPFDTNVQNLLATRVWLLVGEAVSVSISDVFHRGHACNAAYVTRFHQQAVAAHKDERSFSADNAPVVGFVHNDQGPYTISEGSCRKIPITRCPVRR